MKVKIAVILVISRMVPLNTEVICTVCECKGKADVNKGLPESRNKLGVAGDSKKKCMAFLCFFFPGRLMVTPQFSFCI